MARRSDGTWRIHFFRRHPQDDHRTAVPALDFLDAIPTKLAAEIHAVLDAVAEAPPPAFSGGGKWEAMHGWMAGVYEIRVQGGGQNHRLFCLLDRGEDLGGPSIVCLGGLSKPPRQPANDRDYRRIKRYVDEFQKRRTILQ
jgi:hypothetical protein